MRLLLQESQVHVAMSMKIGEVAQRSGLSVKTIRFYCDAGLCTCTSLQATIRSKAGEIEENITALRHLHQEVNALLSNWDD